MKKYLKNNLIKISIWIFAEIVLNFVGIDDLADYSEFVFDSSQNLHNLPVLMILPRSL